MEDENKNTPKEEKPAWMHQMEESMENFLSRLSNLLTPQEQEEQEPTNEIPVPKPPEPPTPEPAPEQEEPETPPKKKRGLLDWLL